MKNFSFRHVAITSVVALSLVFMWGSAAPAQAALTASQIQAVVGLLQSFGVDQTTVTSVQATLRGLPTTTSQPSNTAASNVGCTITYTLTLGSSGSEVSCLQRLLVQDPAIYPSGIVSGYYGPLTEAAIKKWQAEHNLPTTGSVGPLTRDTFLYVGPGTPTTTSSNTSTTQPPAASCTTPWGSKVVASGGTVAWAPYFTNGSYPSPTDTYYSVVPLDLSTFRCSNGGWLVCNSLGNCQPFTPPTTVTPTPTPTPTSNTPTGSCIAYTTTYPNGSQIWWMGQPGPGAPSYLGLTASQWTCSSGTWINTTPSNTSTTQPPAAGCTTSWGTTIASGQSVTGYQNTSLPYGGQCVSQTRTCTNGTLSGVYPYSSCTVAPAPTPTVTNSTSTLPTFNDTFGKSCSTPGATLTVSGGYACGLVCTAVPYTNLTCYNGTWMSPSLYTL